MKRKAFLQAAGLAALALTATGALAQAGAASAPASAAAGAFPSRPIRMIVPFPPGGGTDILSRLVAQKLTEQAKWTIVPDNKAGAGGTIGISEAVKAAPTGYDLIHVYVVALKTDNDGVLHEYGGYALVSDLSVVPNAVALLDKRHGLRERAVTYSMRLVFEYHEDGDA